MRISPSLTSVLICCTALSLSCKKESGVDDTQGALDKFVISTRVPLNSSYLTRKWYVGTFKDLDVAAYTNEKATHHPNAHWPRIELYKDFVFVLDIASQQFVIRKYQREPDGVLADAGSMPVPGSFIDIVIENDTRGYMSFDRLGKIAVFNPSTMQVLHYIDLTSYAKTGTEGTPGPANLLLRNNKLYVACMQKTIWDMSLWPAQVLIVDLANGNAITSSTDNRSTTAGSVMDPKSMFFDEHGDLYVFCQASYGKQSDQKCGFLRIRNGETTFDPSYLFNIADYVVPHISGGQIRNLHYMQYVSNGMLYGTGNVQVLSYNGDPADKTLASFKVDLANKTITYLDLPYSNSYAGKVLAYQGKIYWGLATLDGVGIYRYDPATNTASADPVMTTEGDPVGIEVFE